MEASNSLNFLFARDYLRDICSFLKLALCCSRKLTLEKVNCLKPLNHEIIVTRDQAFGSAHAME